MTRSLSAAASVASVMCCALLAGCASSPSSEAAAPKPATLSCPALAGAGAQSNVDFATLFGVDQKLSARLDRTVRFAQSLQQSARELTAQTNEACRVLTVDLGGTVAANEPPCTALGMRVQQLKQSLNGGFRAQVSGLSCSLPNDALSQCAGECLTGQSGVTSAVSCQASLQNPSQTGCSLDFDLPNASKECATNCAATALGRVSCTGRVELTIGNGEVTPPEYLAMAEALRRDLPKLFGLALSVAPRGAAIAKDSVQLIDDLAATIDDLAQGAPALDRRAVTSAVLGACVAPKLIEIVRASKDLDAALSVAMQAQASFR